MTLFVDIIRCPIYLTFKQWLVPPRCSAVKCFWCSLRCSCSHDSLLWICVCVKDKWALLLHHALVVRLLQLLALVVRLQLFRRLLRNVHVVVLRLLQLHILAVVLRLRLLLVVKPVPSVVSILSVFSSHDESWSHDIPCFCFLGVAAVSRFWHFKKF